MSDIREKNNNVYDTERLVDVTPDVRLLRVLRNSGFNLQTAMGEILDNSLDAGANEIDVYAFLNNKQRKNIMIIDNGKGMDLETLKHSLTLAKELKNGIDQLGKFGMGMKTAALSLSTQFEVITKSVTGEIIFGEFNINKMEHLGEYKTDVRYANEEEKVFFRNKLGKKARSGTIIIIKNCDRFDISFGTFVKQMDLFIGLTYKNYINRGINFTVNDLPVRGEQIKAIDALMREEEGTAIIWEREVIPVECFDGVGKKRKAFVEISAAILPKTDKASKGKKISDREIRLPLNQTNQGIYFYREGRLVGQALSWSNVFGDKHNSKNRFRIEITFKSDLDEDIRMNFQKGNVSPTTLLKNQLEKIIEPLMEKMRNRLNEEEKSLGIDNSIIDDVKINKNKGNVLSTVMVPKGGEKPSEKGFIIESREGKINGGRYSEKKTMAEDSKEIKGLMIAAKKIRRLLMDENTPKKVRDEFNEILNVENVVR